MKAKMGNYLIFFPSYRFMEDVYQEFTQLLASDEEEMELVIQQKHMDEEERENFLRAFEMGREKKSDRFWSSWRDFLRRNRSDK